MSDGLPPVPVPVPVELLRDDRGCACTSEYAMFCFFFDACPMLPVVLRRCRLLLCPCLRVDVSLINMKGWR